MFNYYALTVDIVTWIIKMEEDGHWDVSTEEAGIILRELLGYAMRSQEAFDNLSRNMDILQSIYVEAGWTDGKVDINEATELRKLGLALKTDWED